MDAVAGCCSRGALDGRLAYGTDPVITLKELDMSNADTQRQPAAAGAFDMKLEVVVIPVSDVDRARRFYGDLGWRLDLDYAAGDDFRVIQFTPPGSGCSVIFGKNVSAAAPGSAKGLHLIVSDIQIARDELLRRGVEISEPFHDAGGVFHHAGAEGLVLRVDRIYFELIIHCRNRSIRSSRLT